jgi:hypothetical protein
VSLIELLRQARASTISVIHEFRLYHDPGELQVHAFVEGQADKCFYAQFIRPRLAPNAQLHIYDCHGKAKVMDAMRRLKADYPDARIPLFFVDKDLDELLGPHPSSDSLFVTDVYSIENYIDNWAIVQWLEENLHTTGVRFKYEIIVRLLIQRCESFQRSLLPVMAWVLSHRRCESRPNLGDIDLSQVFTLNANGFMRRRDTTAALIKYLDRVAQVKTSETILSEFRSCAQLLKRLEPKVWVRGKFLVWFWVQFVREMERALMALAKEEGKAKARTQIDASGFVGHLVPKIREPATLTSFLDGWLPLIR